MQTNRGIAPLIILAIIALLAVGTGGAVYVSKEKQQQATSTPVVASVPTSTIMEINTINQATTTTTAQSNTQTKIPAKSTVTTSTKQPSESATIKSATAVAPVGSPRYYMQSGKDWECRIENDKGTSTWSYSRSYPNRMRMYSHYYLEPKNGGGWHDSYDIIDFSKAIEYKWGGFNNLSYTILFNRCQLRDELIEFRGLNRLACTFVQKDQDPKDFELPTDMVFQPYVDNRADGCSLPG